MPGVKRKNNTKNTIEDKQGKTTDNVPIETMPNLPQNLWQAYDKGELVVFVGAGISRLMGCRGWEDMANDLINACCPPVMANQIISGIRDSKIKITIAERYAKKEKVKGKQFWKIFHKAIKPGKNQEDIYSDIANLGTLFITTNCDGLLVKKFPNSFTVDCTENNYTKHHEKSKRYNPFIFCIHGNYGKGTHREKSSLVFTTDSYLQRYKENGELPRFLRRIMKENTVLFLGYGLSEFEILSTVFDDKLKNQPAKHYMLQGFWSYEQELCNALSEYYEGININLIAFCKDQNSYDQQKSIIRDWIEQLKNKTSYNSIGIEELGHSIGTFSQENMDKVFHAFHRRDSSGSILRESFYHNLPTTNDCFKFISVLCEKGMLDFDTIPPIEYRGQSYRCPVWPLGRCILDCIKNYTPEIPEKESLIKIIKDNTIIAATNNEVFKNDVAISQLIELFVRLDVAPQSENEWLVWEKWINTELNIYFITDYLPSILEWDESTAIRLIKMVFSPKDNRREDGYYLKKISELIARQGSLGIIRETVDTCIDSVFTYSDVLYYKCFEERLSFMRGGYLEAQVKSIIILLRALDDTNQEEYLNRCFDGAGTTFTLQGSLYIASALKKGDILFLHEPLNHNGVFADFYIWLDALIENHYLFRDEQVDLLSSWIADATFGYKEESSLGRLSEEDVAYIQKIKDTQKYQLYQLLVMIDDRFKDDARFHFSEQSDIFLQKTPVEDLKQYYLSQDLPKYFSNENLSEYSGEDLIRIVISKHKGSIWKNEPNELSTICEELFEIITDVQVESLVCEIPKIDPINLSPFLMLFGNKKVTKRVRREVLCGTIEQMISVCNNADSPELRIRIIKTIVDCLCSLRDEWPNDSLLQLILGIDYQRIFTSHEEPHAEMDVVMNLLNTAESRLCIEAVSNAVYCRSDDTLIQRFKEWMNAVLHVDEAYWIKLSCAYSFRGLLFIDEEWTRANILTMLQKDSAEIALALCCGTRVVIPEIVDYIQNNDTLRMICQEQNGVNSRLFDQVIVFVVAAHYFHRLDEDKYLEFVQSLGDENVHHLIWSILYGVEGGNDKRSHELLLKTYDLYIQSNEASRISDAIIRYYARKEHFTVEDWRFMAQVASKVSNDSSNWDSIDECLKKTETVNEYIAEVLNGLIEKDVLPPDYILERVIIHLEEKDLFKQGILLARLAVSKGVMPVRMSAYELEFEKKMNIKLATNLQLRKI